MTKLKIKKQLIDIVSGKTTCTASKSNKSVLWSGFNGRLELIFFYSSQHCTGKFNKVSSSSSLPCRRCHIEGQSTSFDSISQPVCKHYKCHITFRLMDGTHLHPELLLHYSTVAWLWLIAHGFSVQVMNERVEFVSLIDVCVIIFLTS